MPLPSSLCSSSLSCCSPGVGTSGGGGACTEQNSKRLPAWPPAQRHKIPAENIPENAVNISVTNNNSTNTLGGTWIKPAGNVDYYNISVTGAITTTIQTNTTQVNVTGLLPGREYNVTVQTVSGTCSQTSAPVTEATYPTPASNLIFKIIETNYLALSWMEPVNMTGVMKSYNIIYGNSSSTWTVTSSTTNVTLLYLMSGTNYTITVVTVGVRGYKSSPVSTSVYTSQPDQPNNITIHPSLSSGSMDITFLPFGSSRPIVAYAVIITTEMKGNRPPWGILSKTYNNFTNKLTNTYVTCIVAQTVALRSARASEINVRVGDGKKTHAYVNGALDPQLQYRVSIAGFNDIKYDPSTDTINEEKSLVSFTNYTGSVSPTNITTTTNITATTAHGTTSAPSNTGAIVGGVIGSLVGISMLIGVGFWFWKKRNVLTNNKNYEAWFEEQQANNNSGFIMEFESLQSVGILQPRSASLHPTNTEKNRQDAVYPYDVSRVKLSSLKCSSDDYINANYVPGVKSEKEFIAAQHPLPGTIRDFWYMIWEKRINTVVMLSDRLENYQEQGEEYWPRTGATLFGDIRATFMSEDIHGGWTVRDFMVSNVSSKENRQVRQFHFTDWHENGEMEDRNVLIQFVQEVQQHKKINSANSPTLVHCRTGNGRSGIFIALDCVINQMEGDGNIDVYGIVHKMYLHRPLMVQTQAQYMFLHRCTLDIVRGKKPVRTPHTYQNVSYETVYEEIPLRPSTQENAEPYERFLDL